MKKLRQPRRPTTPITPSRAQWDTCSPAILWIPQTSSHQHEASAIQQTDNTSLDGFKIKTDKWLHFLGLNVYQVKILCSYLSVLPSQKYIMDRRQLLLAAVLSITCCVHAQQQHTGKVCKGEKTLPHPPSCISISFDPPTPPWGRQDSKS